MGVAGTFNDVPSENMKTRNVLFVHPSVSIVEITEAHTLTFRVTGQVVSIIQSLAQINAAVKLGHVVSSKTICRMNAHWK